MSSLFLQWHLGLGDAIVCNGLVRVLAQTHDQIILPAKFDKLASVIWMFSDMPNVFVVPVKDDSESGTLANQHESKMGLGMFSKKGLNKKVNWDEQFYDDAGIPFDTRWSMFHAPMVNAAVGLPTSEYAMIHHEPARGMTITQKPSIPAFEPPKPPHIFWNVAFVSCAKEIHVVNSCFLNLAESIPTQATRLVLHNYARKDTTPPTLRKTWEILQ